jgi:hypothetical protein
MLCPVVWCAGNGSILVMRAAEPFTKEEYVRLWDKGDLPDCGWWGEEPYEYKAEDWGRLLDGRIVVLDYAAGSKLFDDDKPPHRPPDQPSERKNGEVDAMADELICPICEPKPIKKPVAAFEFDCPTRHGPFRVTGTVKATADHWNASQARWEKALERARAKQPVSRAPIIWDDDFDDYGVACEPSGDETVFLRARSMVETEPR